MHNYIKKFLSKRTGNNASEIQMILSNMLDKEYKGIYIQQYFNNITKILSIMKEIIDNDIQSNLIKYHNSSLVKTQMNIKSKQEQPEIITDYLSILFCLRLLGYTC